jgi:ATP dependent DNA ligase domain
MRTRTPPLRTSTIPGSSIRELDSFVTLNSSGIGSPNMNCCFVGSSVIVRGVNPSVAAALTCVTFAHKLYVPTVKYAANNMEAGVNGFFICLQGIEGIDFVPCPQVLDGEIVALNESGMPAFYHLMRRKCQPVYYAFDLLWLDGKDLRDLPLLERKKILQSILPRKSSWIGYVSFIGHGFSRAGAYRNQ